MDVLGCWGGTRVWECPEYRGGSSHSDHGGDNGDHLQYYHRNVDPYQSRELQPLLEDLADWIGKTLGLEYLKGENLLDLLDNGVILCQLSSYIQDRAQRCVAAGFTVPAIPSTSSRCFRNAARRSFFSRDNVEKFIHFCKKLGVHSNLLFESDDLVMHNHPRSVVLCLLEVSRLACRYYGVEPPGLVKLEREIALQEEQEHDSGLEHDESSSWNGSPTPPNLQTPSPPPLRNNTSGVRTIPTSLSIISKNNDQVDSFAIKKCEEQIPNLRDNFAAQPTSLVNGDAQTTIEMVTTRDEEEWSHASSDHSSDMESERPIDSSENLDQKVQRATSVVRKQCRCAQANCEKFKVKKLAEGKYMIAGRRVFVRLLKGRHMMVRVGGGWDTLENFLYRHDPCQSNARSKPSQVTPKIRKRHSTPQLYRAASVMSN